MEGIASSRLKPSSRCRGLDLVSLCPRYFDVPCRAQVVLSWNDWSPERAQCESTVLAEQREASPFLGALLLLRKDVDYLPMAIQVYHLSNSGIRLDLVGISHSDRSIGSPHLRLWSWSVTLTRRSCLDFVRLGDKMLLQWIGQRRHFKMCHTSLFIAQV